MIVYFDTSALIKVLHQEEDWEHAASIWNAADVLLASRLVYPEARAALAAAARGGRLDPRGHRMAKADLERRWDQLRVIEVSDGLARAAGELAERLRLRAIDAVHLASAAAVAEEGLTLATWDRGLARAAQQAGLAVAPSVPN
jgi:uncharacterized protein